MGLAHTYKSNHFAAEVAHVPYGKKMLKFNSEISLRHFINKLEVGEKLSVTIAQHKPRRTQSQNNYYWGVYLPLISQETGESDLDRLHELFKGKFLTREIVEVLGEKVRIKKSTTDLSVSDFGQYIMNIEDFTGIVAPPVENYDLAPLKRNVEFNFQV